MKSIALAIFAIVVSVTLFARGDSLPTATFPVSGSNICVGVCGSRVPFQLRPIDGSPPWNVAEGSFPNPWGSRENHVLNFGWNLANGGGVYVTGEPAVGWSFESLYAPSQQYQYAEAHLFYVTTSGQQLRPFTWAFDRTTNEVWGGIFAKRFSFGWMAGQQPSLDVFAQEGGGGALYLGAAGHPFWLQANWNGGPFLYQRNGAGTGYVDIAHVDSADRVRIAPGGQTASFGGAVQLGTSGPSWTSGAGAPSSACVRGSLYSRTDAAPSLYVCESVDAWVPK